MIISTLFKFLLPHFPSDPGAARHVREMAIRKGRGPEECASLIKLREEWLGIEARGKG